MYFIPGKTYGESLEIRRQEIAARKAEKAKNLQAARDNGAISMIMTELLTVLADLDATMLQNQKTWAKARVAAIKEYQAENQPKRREMGEHKYYEGLFSVAGGKTWYNVFNGRNAKMIEEFIAKNCQAIAEVRNAKITKGLVELGVTELLEQKAEHSSDGFNGYFRVETKDKGVHTVSIQTIYAGGYNIQCYHQRTLVRVR